jgi:hypothetical protein
VKSQQNEKTRKPANKPGDSKVIEAGKKTIDKRTKEKDYEIQPKST